MQGIPENAAPVARLVQGTANANAAATGQTIQYVQEVISEAAGHYDSAVVDLLARIDSLTQTVGTLQIALQNQQALVAAYKQQVDALPASTGTGSSRQPKIGEPPIFYGSDNKIKLAQWLRLIVLWCEHEGIATDKQRIVVALSKLQGAAQGYMESYYTKLTNKQDVGSWDNFVDELQSIYGQRDEKEGAKKEITALFTNTTLAHKDFVKYAEQFRTLGRTTGYDDELLIDKLRNVINREMRLVLAGKDQDKLPNTWTKFLDLLLTIHKIVYPEQSAATIFGKNSDKSNDNAMDVDTASTEKKKKGKGKGKGKKEEDANTATTDNTNKQKFCHICKQRNHNTDACFQLVRNAAKRPASRSPPGNNNSRTQSKPAKRTRVIEIEVTDDEDDAPGSSAVNVASAEIEATTQVQLEDDELSASMGKVKISAQPRMSQDFLKRCM